MSRGRRGSRAGGVARRLVLAAAAAIVLAGAAEAFQATWTRQRDVPGYPQGPMGTAWLKLAHDPVARRVVLIAGSGSTYGNDVWHYDTAADQWTMLEPFVDCGGIGGFTPMTKRDEHTVDYDPVNHRYWVFGGSGFGCKAGLKTAGAGTTTTQVVDPALPATEDGAYTHWTVESGGKKAYVAAYHAATRTVVLATPISGLGPGDAYYLYPQRGGGTWWYDPGAGAWGSLDGPAWGYGGPSPSSRLSPGTAFAPAHAAMLMFGGNVQANDTWVLDAVTRSWVRVLASGAPGAPTARTQIENSMVYDQHADRFILFGGRCNVAACGGSGTLLGDTWAYDLSSNTWSQLAPAGGPSPRDQVQMAYDPVNRVTVLFGGRDASGKRDDLWVFDAGTVTWTPLAPAVSPPPGSLGSMVHDPDAGVFVLYRGRQLWTLRLVAGPTEPNPAPAITGLSPASRGGVRLDAAGAAGEVVPVDPVDPVVAEEDPREGLQQPAHGRGSVTSGGAAAAPAA
jgi:hypothetical protein